MASIVTFALGSFPQVVGLARGLHADLSDDHDVQAAVQLAIAGARKSVTHHVARGHLDRGGAGVAGERGRRPEPVNITDSSEDLTGGQYAQAMHVGQGGAGCGHSGLNIVGGLGDPAVKLAHLADKIPAGQCAAGRRDQGRARGVVDHHQVGARDGGGAH